MTTATAAAEGRARGSTLEAKLDAARVEMAALRNRPWWARLATLARDDVSLARLHHGGERASMPRTSPLAAASRFHDDDPVGRLIVHYFDPADMLRAAYVKAERSRSARNEVSWRDGRAVNSLSLWFALLYPVIEGYQELGLQDATVDLLLGRTDMVGHLRVFRNGRFHYQRKPDKLIGFLSYDDGAGFEWADQLHRAFEVLFSAYRVETTVRNLSAEDRPCRRPGPQPPTRHIQAPLENAPRIDY